MSEFLRVAYADPPYPGQCAKHYADHPDYAGEVDHRELLGQLSSYAGWALSTSSVALRDVLILAPADVRVMAWIKPFAAYKRNVKVAYTWEPVLVKAARPAVPNRIEGIVCRDHIAESITMQRGLTGAKPQRFCWWLFEVLGLDPDDDFVDLFPGSDAVARAHASWKQALRQTSMEVAA